MPRMRDVARMARRAAPGTRLLAIGPALRQNRDPIGAILLKLGGAFFSFLIIFIVARASGPAITGDYSMAIASAMMASLVATMGLDQIAIRTIGGDLREGRQDLAWAALMAVIRLVLPLSIVSAIVLLAGSRFAPLIGASSAAMAAASASVVAFPLLRVAVVTMRAAGSMLMSQFLDVAHSIIILGAVAGLMLVGSGGVRSSTLALLYSGAICTTATSAWIILLLRTRNWPRGAISTAPLLSASWRILATSFCHSLTQWTVLAQVGAELGADDVGAYRVANQFVMILALMLTTIEAFVSPQLAGDFRIGDVAGAWRRHRQATLLMLMAAAAPLLLCILIPKQLLALFGPAFVGASTALMILSAGQTINVLTGPIGGVMVMSGNERLSLKLSLIGFFLTVALSLVLIPRFALVGAAISGASSMIFRNVAAFMLMRRKLRPSGSSQPRV